MKKKGFLGMLVVLLFACITLFNACKPKCTCCDLPAPENLTVTNITPETANLDWSPVTGAVAYQVTVWEVPSGTLFLVDTVVQDSLVLTGLTPGTNYSVVVQAVCDEDTSCVISPNVASTCFQTRNLIIQDTVVMREIGENGTCHCDSTGGTYTIINTSLFSLNPPPPTGGTTRHIYKFKIAKGSKIAYFKLAYDGSCINNMKGYLCSQTGITVPQPRANNIEFHENNVKFLTLTPASNGTVSVTWENNCSSGCSIEYRSCGNSWSSECP